MIRHLDLSDDLTLETLLGLQLASYEVEARIIGHPDLPPLRETTADLARCGETFFGYFDEDRLTGAISFKIEASVLDIHRLMVHPAHFRQGIARALLAHLEESVSTDITKTVVSTGSGNLPARRLYLSQGFVERGEFEVERELWITRFEKTMLRDDLPTSPP